MLTPTHGCLANLFSRLFKRRWSAKTHFYFFLGAIVPDMPILAAGCIELIKYYSVHPFVLEWHSLKNIPLNLLYKNEMPAVAGTIWSKVGYYELAIILRQCLHSVVFWLVLMAVACLLPRIRRVVMPLARGALFFHILVDWPTHTVYAYNYFWPLWDFPIRGFISHENPWLLRVEITIWAAYVLYRLLCRFVFRIKT